MEELPLTASEEMQGDLIELLSDLQRISELVQSPKTLDMIEAGAAVIAHRVKELRAYLNC